MESPRNPLQRGSSDELHILTLILQAVKRLRIAIASISITGIANRIPYFGADGSLTSDSTFTRDATTKFTNISAEVDTDVDASISISDDLFGLGVNGAGLHTTGTDSYFSIAAVSDTDIPLIGGRGGIMGFSDGVSNAVYVTASDNAGAMESSLVISTADLLSEISVRESVLLMSVTDNNDSSVSAISVDHSGDHSHINLTIYDNDNTVQRGASIHAHENIIIESDHGFQILAPTDVILGVTDPEGVRVQGQTTDSTRYALRTYAQNATAFTGTELLGVRCDGRISTTTSINTTAGDSATINTASGRFRKDTSGTAFTLTNSLITANSIILLTPCQVDATATHWGVTAGAGSCTINFNAVPTSNFDMNFLVIN